MRRSRTTGRLPRRPRPSPIPPDLEIAWENLGLAHSILSHLVDGIILMSYDDKYKDKDNNAKNDEYGGRSGEKVALKSDNVNNDDKEEAGGGGAPTTAEELKNELLLDLAQVHERLGNNMLPCLDDYDRALRLRLCVLGKYVKKVADCHFGLAQIYAEAPNQLEEGEGRVESFVAGILGGGPPSRGGGAATMGRGNYDEDDNGAVAALLLTEEKKSEYRRLSSEHY